MGGRVAAGACGLVVLALRDELGNLEVPGAEARGTAAADPRLALGLAEAARARAACRAVAVAGRHHGHPALVGDFLVDHRPENDVGARVSRLGDGPRGFVDL